MLSIPRLVRTVGLLAMLALAPSVQATPANFGGQAYVDYCRAQGVPIPPPFSLTAALSGGTGWLPSINPGGTDNILVEPLASRESQARVYYYETADGLCMAIPRGNDAFSTLLGVICQGNRTSKACFWDSPETYAYEWVYFDDPGNGERTFVGGSDLADDPQGVCTDCHAGSNAFVVTNALFEHPGTQADNWVDPLVSSNWPQNVGPGSYFWQQSQDVSCVSCHRDGGRKEFPNLGEELFYYCERLLGFSSTEGALWSDEGVIVAGIMPPQNVGSHAGLEEIRQACQQPLATGPIARASYNHALYRQPWTFEVDVLDSFADDGYEALHALIQRPYIPLARSAVELDGLLDADWLENTRPQPVRVGTRGSVTQRESTTAKNGNPLDSSATWRAAWDENNLYVFVSVTDDVVSPDVSAQVWDDDSVEVLIDARGERNATYDGNDTQFVFRPGDPNVYTGLGRSGENTSGVVVVTAPTDDGYDLELSFPWTTLGDTPGGQIGFEVQINDDDNGGARDTQLAWRTNSTAVETNPSLMSRVNLPYPISGKLDTTPILVDGRRKELDWQMPGVPLERVPAPIAGTSDASATWRATWDARYLYFFVTVEDDILWPFDSEKAYDDDSVEIFIDGNNSRDDLFDGHDDFQFIFRYGENGPPHAGDLSLEGAPDIVSKSRATASGYALEVAIPWTSIKTSPAEWGNFGFEIQINDDDDGGPRDGKLSWCSESNDSYFDTQYFCVAQLFAPVELGTPTINRIARNPVAGEPSISDPLTGTSILNVDGNIYDEIWAEQTTFQIAEHNLGSPTMYGTWAGAWNEEYLYVRIFVNETGGPVGGDAAWWQDDSVEIYVDGNHSRNPAYDRFDQQFTFRPGNDDEARLKDGIPLPAGSGLRSRWQPNSNGNGYAMEIAIPWRLVGVLPEAGANIGFEVQLNDDDVDGNPNRVGKLAWFATPFIGDVAYLRPDAFANLRLVQPAPPPRQELEVFFDDFTEGLIKWTETGEGDWIAEEPHKTNGYPPSASGSPILNADNCDTDCAVTLRTGLDLSAGYQGGRLEFLRFVDNQLDAGDFLKLELSYGDPLDWEQPDDERDWTEVAVWESPDSSDERWHFESFDLAPYLGSKSFKLRFSTRTSLSSEHVQVDDMRIIVD